MVKRSIGGVERDYLLARVQGRRQALRALRPDRPAPPLHRRGDTRASAASAARTGRRPSRGSARPSARSPRSWSCCTRSASTRAGHAFAPDTPWQAEMEAAFPYTETADQLKAIADVKADMEAAVADGPPGLRRRRLRQDRGRHPGRLQGRPGRQAGGGAGPDHAAGLPAPPDLRRPLRRLPGPGRDAVPLPHAGAGPGGDRRAGRRFGRRRHRHPPAAVGRRRLQGPRPARRRRGAALRGHPQGGHQEAAHRRRRADPDRHADPPHPRDEPDRDPGPDPAATPRRPSASRS